MKIKLGDNLISRGGRGYGEIIPYCPTLFAVAWFNENKVEIARTGAFVNCLGSWPDKFVMLEEDILSPVKFALLLSGAGDGNVRVNIEPYLVDSPSGIIPYYPLRNVLESAGFDVEL